MVGIGDVIFHSERVSRKTLVRGRTWLGEKRLAVGVVPPCDVGRMIVRCGVSLADASASCTNSGIVRNGVLRMR